MYTFLPERNQWLYGLRWQGGGEGRLIGFWLCGQSKGPHQRHEANASHSLPCLFSSVYISATQCNQNDESRKREMDEEEDSDILDIQESTRTGTWTGICVSKARLSGPKPGKWEVECRNDRIFWRDVVELCLQTTVTQRTVTLGIACPEFVDGLPQLTNNQGLFTSM